MSEIREKFLEILERQVNEYSRQKVNFKELPLDSKLEELGLDSLTYLEAINELEDQLYLVLGFSANDQINIETLGDLLKLVDEESKKY